MAAHSSVRRAAPRRARPRLRMCPPGVPFLSSLSLSVATCALSLALRRSLSTSLLHPVILRPPSIHPFSNFMWWLPSRQLLELLLQLLLIRPEATPSTIGVIRGNSLKAREAALLAELRDSRARRLRAGSRVIPTWHKAASAEGTFSRSG